MKPIDLINVTRYFPGRSPSTGDVDQWRAALEREKVLVLPEFLSHRGRQSFAYEARNVAQASYHQDTRATVFLSEPAPGLSPPDPRAVALRTSLWVAAGDM